MHPGIFQWVKQLRNGIVLVVSLLAAIVKDLVALSKWSTFLCLHGLVVVALRCTYELSHGHTNVIHTLHS